MEGCECGAKTRAAQCCVDTRSVVYFDKEGREVRRDTTVAVFNVVYATTVLYVYNRRELKCVGNNVVTLHLSIF